MNWIVEIQGRDSKSVHHHVVNGDTVRIGRAYDNDIILNDVFVCPHHASLHIDSQGAVQFIDHDSVNGSYDRRHKRLHGDTPVSSGDQILLGQTHLRLYDRQHPVAAAIPRHAVDTVLRKAAHPGALLLLLATLIGCFVSEEYLLATDEIQFMSWLQASLSMLLLPLLWSLLWILVARLTKHEARFNQQFAIALAFTSLFILTDGVTEFLRYNFHSNLAKQLAEWGIGLALTWGLLWFNLYASLAQEPRRRITAASTLSLLLLGIGLVFNLEGDEFSSTPNYNSSLMPPALQMTQGATDAAVLQAAGAVFEDLPVKGQER